MVSKCYWTEGHFHFIDVDSVSFYPQWHWIVFYFHERDHYWSSTLLEVFLIWARKCSSLQQKAVCQLVIWLLHEAWNSSIKSSARNLHHYSLEVSALCFLNRNKRSSGHEHCSFKVVYVHTSRVVLFNPCVASGHLRIVLLMLPVISFVF